jgi:hypothetical protein
MYPVKMSLAQVMPPFERGGLDSRADDEMLLIGVLPNNTSRQLLYGGCRWVCCSMTVWKVDMKL